MKWILLLVASLAFGAEAQPLNCEILSVDQDMVNAFRLELSTDDNGDGIMDYHYGLEIFDAGDYLEASLGMSGFPNEEGEEVQVVISSNSVTYHMDFANELEQFQVRVTNEAVKGSPGKRAGTLLGRERDNEDQDWKQIPYETIAHLACD